MCISYFSIAVFRHRNQCNLLKKESISGYSLIVIIVHDGRAEEAGSRRLEQQLRPHISNPSRKQ